MLKSNCLQYHTINDSLIKMRKKIKLDFTSPPPPKKKCRILYIKKIILQHIPKNKRDRERQSKKMTIWKKIISLYMVEVTSKNQRTSKTLEYY